MNFPMRGEIGLGGEVLAAGVAHVLGLAGVHVLHVGLQAAQVTELFVT